MLRFFYILFFAFLFNFPASSQSNPPPSTTNLRVEQLQQQINQLQTELKAVQNNPADHDNIVTLNKGLPDLEKRVEDIHQYVAYWGGGLGITIALFGTLLTGIVIFFSLRTSREAIAEAKQAAEKEVNAWVIEKGDTAIKPLEDSLQAQGAEILTNIRQQVIETIENLKTEADQHRQQLSAFENEHRALLDRADFSQDDKEKKLLDVSDVAELRSISEQLNLKPEDQYTFNDWRALYLDASNRLALDSANKYVEKMECIAANDWEDATAKTSRAWLLRDHQHFAEAIQLSDEVVEKFKTSEDSLLIERCANAMLLKGQIYYEQNQLEASIAMCREIALKYTSCDDAKIAAKVVQAQYIRSWMLNKQGQWKDAIAVQDDVVSHYGTRNEASVALYVARSLFDKAYTLGQQGDLGAEIDAYDDLVSRYGARTEADIAEQVAQSLRNKSYRLGIQNQWLNSIAACDDMISRYGLRTEANIIIVLAQTMFNRALALERLQRIFEAKMAYAMLIERYAPRTEIEILKLVEDAKKAIFNLGNV